MQSITLEVILRAVFGVEDDERRQDLRRNLVGILATTRSAAGDRDDRRPAAPPSRLPADQADARARRTEILLAEIDERRADPDLASRDDILSLLVGARFEDGSAMSDAELRDQLITLLLAGHETTATGLAWAFDLLFRAPEQAGAPAGRGRGGRPRLPGRGDRGDASHSPGGAVGGAQAERRSRARGLRAARGHGGDGGDLPRPHPPGPLPRARRLSPRTVPRTGGPDTYSWIPFGGGTRRCIGAAFAQLEMRVVLAHGARPGRARARPGIDPSRSCAETSPCRRATAPRRSSSAAAPLAASARGRG